MVLFTASTDVLDGGYAHLVGTRSDFSQQLDTMADMAVIFSAPGLIALLFPDVARQRASHVGLVILVAAPVLLLEWRKFRRLGGLHINSARATAFVAHLWVLNLLGRNQDSKLLFRLFLGAAGGAALESLYVIIRQPDLDRLSETPLLDDLCATFGVANPIAALLLSDPTRQTTRK